MHNWWRETGRSTLEYIRQKQNARRVRLMFAKNTLDEGEKWGLNPISTLHLILYVADIDALFSVSRTIYCQLLPLGSSSHDCTHSVGCPSN